MKNHPQAFSVCTASCLSLFKTRSKCSTFRVIFSFLLTDLSFSKHTCTRKCARNVMRQKCFGARFRRASLTSGFGGWTGGRGCPRAAAWLRRAARRLRHGLPGRARSRLPTMTGRFRPVAPHRTRASLARARADLPNVARNRCCWR